MNTSRHLFLEVPVPITLHPSRSRPLVGFVGLLLAALLRGVHLRARFLEAWIAADPHTAYLYARYFLRGRFVAGEEMIAQEGGTAFRYACRVLNRYTALPGPIRFLRGEPAISSCPWIAFQYAESILRSSWPEAEPSISRDPRASFYYAALVLRRTFPAGEQALSQDAAWAYMYAVVVLNGRFVPAEEVILRSEAAEEYRWQFLENRKRPEPKDARVGSALTACYP